MGGRRRRPRHGYPDRCFRASGSPTWASLASSRHVGGVLFRGLTYQVLDNVSLSPFPKGYYNIANGFLNGLLGGNGDVFTW